MNTTLFAFGLLILILFTVAFYSFGSILRKKLDVEKAAMFSYNHVNAKHKKIDWTLRIAFTVILLVNLFVYMSEHTALYIQPYMLLFLFIITIELVRIYMEKKYAKNKKTYIATAAELAFIIVFIEYVWVFINIGS